MLKTVKVKKNLRLDELIKYVFDNGIEDKTYGVTDAFNNTSEVRISGSGNIKLSGYINKHTIFTVEEEEEINNKTIFKSIVGVLNNDRIMLTNTNSTIEDIQDEYGSMKEIHAVIDGKLELIYERNENV